MKRRGSGPQQFPDVEQEIGENPARYLDADLLMDDNARELFHARLRGIHDQRVAARWLEVEHRLDREDCPRSAVVEKLEQRAAFLDEHGNRTHSEDPGPDRPLHAGGDPDDPPPKTPQRPGTSEFARKAARHYHYITKAIPFLEARDRRRDEREMAVDAEASPPVATDGGDDAGGIDDA